MHRLFAAILLLSGLMLSGLASTKAAEVLSIAPDIYSPREGVDRDPAAAQRLLDEAKRAAEAGQSSRALRLATSALEHDPDEPTCRRVLGYESVDGRWVTPFQKKQLGRGLVWDARFGWLKADELPLYEAGRRRSGRRWLSAEEDAIRHATIDNGWQVRTDHWLVTTNHSLEAAASLAAELERFFQVWRQLFAAYHLGHQEVLARFEGTRSARVRARPLRVVFHRDKQGYVAALKSKQPRIAETLGIYFDNLREAHFYAAADEDRALSRGTLYHEAAHQLFQEMTRTRKNVGAEANYWLVEAVALYFESLTPVEDPRGAGRFAIGGPGAGRLPAARRRLLTDGYYVPLEELCLLGRADLQRRADLAPLYSQAAGLAGWLMSDGGEQRERLVRGLRRLYTAKTRADDLPRWLGASGFAELDRGYRRFLQDLPAP